VPPVWSFLRQAQPGVGLSPHIFFARPSAAKANAAQKRITGSIPHAGGCSLRMRVCIHSKAPFPAYAASPIRFCFPIRFVTLQRVYRLIDYARLSCLVRAQKNALFFFGGKKEPKKPALIKKTKNAPRYHTRRQVLSIGLLFFNWAAAPIIISSHPTIAAFSGQRRTGHFLNAFFIQRALVPLLVAPTCCVLFRFFQDDKKMQVLKRV